MLKILKFIQCPFLLRSLSSLNLGDAVIGNPFKMQVGLVTDGSRILFPDAASHRSLLRNGLARPHAGWACFARLRAFLIRQCR